MATNDELKGFLEAIMDLIDIDNKGAVLAAGEFDYLMGVLVKRALFLGVSQSVIYDFITKRKNEYITQNKIVN